MATKQSFLLAIELKFWVTTVYLDLEIFVSLEATMLFFCFFFYDIK